MNIFRFYLLCYSVKFLLLTTAQPKYYIGRSRKYQVVSEMVNFGGQDLQQTLERVISSIKQSC